MEENPHEYRIEGSIIKDLIYSEIHRTAGMGAQKRHVQQFTPSLEDMYNEYILYAQMLHKRNWTTFLELENVCAHPNRPVHDARLWMGINISPKCNTEIV